MDYYKGLNDDMLLSTFLKNAKKFHRVYGEYIAAQVDLSQKTISRYTTGEVVPKGGRDKAIRQAVYRLIDSKQKRKDAEVRDSSELNFINDIRFAILDAARQFWIWSKSEKEFIITNHEFFGELIDTDFKALNLFRRLQPSTKVDTIKFLENLSISLESTNLSSNVCTTCCFKGSDGVREWDDSEVPSEFNVSEVLEWIDLLLDPSEYNKIKSLLKVDVWDITNNSITCDVLNQINTLLGEDSRVRELKVFLVLYIHLLKTGISANVLLHSGYSKYYVKFLQLFKQITDHERKEFVKSFSIGNTKYEFLVGRYSNAILEFMCF